MSFLHEMTAEFICLDSSVEIIMFAIAVLYAALYAIIIAAQKSGGGAEAPQAPPCLHPWSIHVFAHSQERIIRKKKG